MGTPLPYLSYEIRSELHITRPSPQSLTQTILLASDKCRPIYKSQVKAMNYDYARAEEIQGETFELMIIITPIRL